MPASGKNSFQSVRFITCCIANVTVVGLYFLEGGCGVDETPGHIATQGAWTKAWAWLWKTSRSASPFTGKTNKTKMKQNKTFYFSFCRHFGLWSLYTWGIIWFNCIVTYNRRENLVTKMNSLRPWLATPCLFYGEFNERLAFFSTLSTPSLPKSPLLFQSLFVTFC